VRGDFTVVRLDQDGQLPGVPDGAERAQSRLLDFDARTQHGRKFNLCRVPLAAGDGNAHSIGNLLKFGNIIRWNRLFEPQRIIGFDGPAKADCIVGTEQKIAELAHRRANGPAKPDRAGDITKGGLVARADWIGAGEVKLGSGIAPVRTVQRRFGGLVGGNPEPGKFTFFKWIEIGSGAQPVIDPAA